MAMQVGAADGEVQSGINTTPLIDVMLVLLVMLIITIPPQRQAVIVDTPQPPAPYPHPIIDPVEPVQVVIDFDGSLYWDGSRIERSSLDARMVAEAQLPYERDIFIEPHQRTSYGEVAAVMAAAQRAGLKKLAVTGGT